MKRSEKAPGTARYELRIFEGSRKTHQLEDTYFSTDGHLVFTDFAAVRALVHKLNARRAPENHVYPGEMFAAGLLHEIHHVLIRKYEEQSGRKKLLPDAYAFLTKQSGEAAIKAMILEFTETYPPSEVFSGKTTAVQHLGDKATGQENTLKSIEEFVLLMLANENPANKKITELIDQKHLRSEKRFNGVIHELEAFFKTLPPFGPEQTDLLSFLRAPMKHSPDDINGQLDYILEHWKDLLPEALLLQILKGKDLMKEDYMLAGGLGPPPSLVPDYKGRLTGAGMHLGKSGFDAYGDAMKGYEEAERFTDDTDWMPRVVLLAKNTYVWLDQLSKKYGRHIHRLDHVPDEELDQLAAWSFNGLWLIGLWERSNASKKIKHKTGNPDAEASAYSLYDYEIAGNLGGDEAYRNLNERARQRGIRLASDMVPNHTGIFSKWVVEHPDFFIQTRIPPFPGYTFNGDNLSDDPNVEIRIEDGYYDKSDAAVVFQRIDRANNDVRYLYHGNDGTMMPWNDTAQLDMIKAEVREAVIGKIFEVARKFSIIRFDAAMTLAKKHFARLWYPQPGSGGDIPSRADYAMTQEAFDELFPVEFWREVVDRINKEMPETLLLAEAFWFMEGYFVRTLGMHRVYNSAFMHMLKNEENEKYRDLITNTLEFEPEILKRYVNFMSNPDEETAIQQFGTGDKYFGICVLMNTMPGLPMFAHGQIEGYTEKYGMEYQRAYYNETPKDWLVAKHEREIFPLTRKRYLFSEVEHFNIFNFSNDQGMVNENVFAYTNRRGDERALVFYNNKYDMARGHIKTSAPRLRKSDEGKQLVSAGLGEALLFKHDMSAFYIAREHISGKEHLFSGDDIHHRGLYLELMGFEYRIFMDFRELIDTDGQVATLCDHLQGHGVNSVEEALKLKRLEAVHHPFRQLFSSEIMTLFLNEFVRIGSSTRDEKTLQQLGEVYAAFASRAFQALGSQDQTPAAAESFLTKWKAAGEAMTYFCAPNAAIMAGLNKHDIESVEQLLVLSQTGNYLSGSTLILALFGIQSIAEHMPAGTAPVDVYDKLMLANPIQEVLAMGGKTHDEVVADELLLTVLLKYGAQLYLFCHEKGTGDLLHESRAQERASKAGLALDMLDDPLVKSYAGVNAYQGVWYYSKESFELLNRWFFSLACFRCFQEKPSKRTAKSSKPSAREDALKASAQFFVQSCRLSERAGYKLNNLTESLKLAAKLT
ncbi:MAG: alpha-amylase family glycosyl hydrolase [Bacteroidales bacterium]|nr:alpha-amylase family glycosyl hydrolase [Bacteroidales bacterium]